MKRLFHDSDKSTRKENVHSSLYTLFEHMKLLEAMGESYSLLPFPEHHMADKKNIRLKPSNVLKVSHKKEQNQAYPYLFTCPRS